MADHEVEALRTLARRAKGASASMSAAADAWRDLGIESRALRARLDLGENAPPASWEVERERFLRRLMRDG